MKTTHKNREKSSLKGSKKSSNSKKKPFSSLWLIIVGIFFTGIIYLLFQLFLVKVHTGKAAHSYFYIHSRDSFPDVIDQINREKWMNHPFIFKMLARATGYSENIKPGRYRIERGMNIWSFFRLLHSGKQEPVRIAIENCRTKEQLAGKVSKKIEPDSLSILSILNDSLKMRVYGLNPRTALALFVPDTYEFLWTTNAEAFVSKMAAEYGKFWNEERIQQARALNLSPSEVITLASIVQQESNLKSEWPVIAGVYLNRMHSGMKLQADPTVIFAHGDFKLRRVKGILNVDSPYNTYLYKGLPPGPISMPTKACIDSTLNPENHQFLFFCASARKPGSHIFAKNWEEHKINATDFRRYLDSLSIK